MELFALGAALSWALGSLFAAGSARHLGGFHFSRLRMSMITFVLIPIAWWMGGFDSVTNHLWPLVISAIIGIVIGDVCLFACMARLGPRRSGILFATNAPMTAFLNVVWYQANYHGVVIFGTLLVMLGVYLAIWFGRKPSGSFNPDEATKGTLLLGVLFGLGAALGQTLGSLIIAPIMASGVEPWSASLVRVGASAIAMQALFYLRFPRLPAYTNRPSGRQLGWVFVSGIFGMVLGQTLLLIAFSQGDLGIATVLSATSPVILLPLLWIKSGHRPDLMAWVGAILTVLGCALVSW